MGKISIGSTIIYDSEAGGGGEPVIEGPVIISAYNTGTNTIQIVFDEALQPFDPAAENLLSFAVIANEYWTQVAYPISAVEFVTAYAINIYTADFENIDSVLSVFYNSYYGSLKALDDTPARSQVFNFAGEFINLKIRRRETWSAARKTLALPDHALLLALPVYEDWQVAQPPLVMSGPEDTYLPVSLSLQPGFTLSVQSLSDEVSLL